MDVDLGLGKVLARAGILSSELVLAVVRMYVRVDVGSIALWLWEEM